MARASTILAVGLVLLGALCASERAYAGDEDVKQEKKPKVEAPAPEDTPVLQEPESPELSVGQEEEKSPEFEPPSTRNGAKPKEAADLDTNIDYSRLLGTVEPVDAPRGVLPPAEGFRGYRPNMVAFTYYDRTPGYGGLVEYSWNRIGAGIYGSYRPADIDGVYQSFGGAYGLYRWLPWGISPYFLLGVEFGYHTDENVGGLAGGGIEARVVDGWTALFGWTFHSTVKRGFLGGAFGWSF